MVFGLIAYNGLKMPLVFFKNGFQIGSKEYLTEILELRILPWVCQNFLDPPEVVLVLDGAWCHTAKSVQDVETSQPWPEHTPKSKSS